MTRPLLSPIPEGTPWPSGEGVDIAIISLPIENLAERIGLPLAQGFEPGLGNWKAIGGRLPSGADIEIICYLSFPDRVFMRVDKHARYLDVFEQALLQLGLSRADFKDVSPLVA